MPHGVFDVFNQFVTITADHLQGLFEQSYLVRKEFTAIALRQRHAFVQAKKQIITAHPQFLELVRRWLVLDYKSDIFQPVDIGRRNTINSLTDNTLELLIANFNHPFMIQELPLRTRADRGSETQGKSWR